VLAVKIYARGPMVGDQEASVREFTDVRTDGQITIRDRAFDRNVRHLRVQECGDSVLFRGLRASHSSHENPRSKQRDYGPESHNTTVTGSVIKAGVNEIVISQTFSRVEFRW